ncbi:Biotin-protein ligase/Biotin operon repressor [Methylophaga thiooxydans]|uniref:Biotin-protein ligase/Biotin operon repressor n=1 Tax=Methylophaga thiooxydans TaxID=392484 RepID=A0A0A0BH61_9GAMM|nr:biotin--[acetyl-CoA-carboxylase] ligase [Methylophaga thiooxydans]KGM06454.1 Biotin-protein ligase/Biotin operon repressor [Methylophaga thiooxydans]
MTTPAFQPLSQAAIYKAIDPSSADTLDDIIILPEVTSTSDTLWERFTAGKITPAVCLAETQTAGRGRRGDPWQSPAAGNLYLSLFWPHCAEKPRHGLSIAVGISLINTLKEAGINQLQLKWPNDVLFNRQKLAGILVESRFNTKQYTVVGIGLNFKLPPSTQTLIQQPSTSLEQLCDTVPCRNWLAGKIIQNMIETIKLFEHRGLSDFLPLWPRYDALHDQAITLIDGDTRTTAIACGINDQGELRYMRDNQIHLLSNSHISIRFAS